MHRNVATLIAGVEQHEHVCSSYRLASSGNIWLHSYLDSTAPPTGITAYNMFSIQTPQSGPGDLPDCIDVIAAIISFRVIGASRLCLRY